MAETCVRGIRGAISVVSDEPEEIMRATREMLQAIVEQNSLNIDDIASAFFTVTPDLRSTFPARAARELGWKYVPLLCAQEIDVPGSLPRIIRVLLHVNTEVESRKIKHVYLREAAQLRPELI